MLFPRAPAAAALCLVLAGCGGQTGVEPQVSRLLVSPARALLVGVGDGMAFSADAQGPDGQSVNADVTWSTGDPAIATVNARGFVTAVAAGATGVTATAGGISATAELEVYVRERIARHEPGVSYFGRNEYVEYIPGELPVILSAPHGGLLAPREIPDRSYGVTVNDTHSLDLTLKMRQALIDLTGYAPHVILSHLRRVKLDPNREIGEAAQDDPYAELAWNEFQDWIVTARSIVTSQFGEGMYFDVHGHGHEIDRIELGYLLTADELNRSDAALDGLPTVRRSSIREIGRTTTIPFSRVLRGPTSFGGLLAEEDVPSVPSPADPGPGAAPYWRGGYNTRVHGSVGDGEVISGIQLEHHYAGVRDTNENRRIYAEKVTRVIRAFMLEHFGFFEPAARLPLTHTRLASWAASNYFVSMDTRLIRIGNSRGVRIPKALIEAAALDAPLRFRVVDSGLLIERTTDPRAGWETAAKDLHDRGEAGLLDEPVPTAFDESEWEWE